MSLYSISFADTMLSLGPFFQVIPHETAVARCVADGERAEISDFCCGIVLGLVQAVEIPAAPAQNYVIFAHFCAPFYRFQDLAQKNSFIF